MNLKKKAFIICGSVLGGILCLLIAGIIILAVNHLTFSVGTYAGNGLVVFGKNGHCSAVVGGNANGVFSGVEPGDKILVLRNNFTFCTYPGTTRMYKCWRLDGGDLSDIPNEELEKLTELGWIHE